MSASAAWANQPVLVTGATGFVGAHVCRLLVEQGALVHGVGRGRIAANEISQVAYHSGDLADAPFAESLLGEIQPRCVFHLASHVVGARDLDQVAATLRDGLVATVNVLTAAARHGRPRVVLAGSLEEPEADGEPLVPSSPYAAAKLAGAAYARMFHALYGLPVVHARIFMVYGPGQRDLRKLIPYTILSLLRGEAPRLSNGERLVDWIYVEDVARGLITLGEQTGIEGQRMDLGTGVLTSVREVALQLTRRVRPDLMPQFGAVAGRPMEQVRRADADATHRATGWRPEVPLDEGLSRTVDWYAQRAAESGR
jgi:nucleoside-diphosphate-sugar epimerase